MSCGADFDDLYTRLQAFSGNFGANQRISAGAQGATSEHHQTTRSPNGRLTVELERCCRAFIASTEQAKVQTEASQDIGLNTWWAGQQQYLKEILHRHEIALGNSTLGSPMMPTSEHTRSYLLELPAELRERIWMHAVTEWTSTLNAQFEVLHEGQDAPAAISRRELIKKPIRMDRFNRPSPPSLTRVSHQLRNETLHLYYDCNIFECWRPLFWLKDWSQSTFIDWLMTLGPQKTKWLQHIVLLYKHEGELEHDVEAALSEEGFVLAEGAIEDKQELSEYEMCFEELGLPRHFGRKRRWDRWLAGSAAS